MSNKKIYSQEEIDSLKSGQKYNDCIFEKLEIKAKDLQDCTFTQCSFVDTNLTGTKFNNTKFSNCNLSNANIAGCNFFSASFSECKLLGLVFPRANSLISATFTKCSFDYADLRGVDLSGLDLSNSTFHETDLSLANLKKTVFINSHITNIKVDGAKLEMTDFRGAELQGFSLKTDNLKGAIFTPEQIQQLAEQIGIHIMETNI